MWSVEEIEAVAKRTVDIQDLHRLVDPKTYSENGGQKCDADSGPCSCGAWHSDSLSGILGEPFGSCGD